MSYCLEYTVSTEFKMSEQENIKNLVDVQLNKHFQPVSKNKPDIHVAASNAIHGLHAVLEIRMLI